MHDKLRFHQLPQGLPGIGSHTKVLHTCDFQGITCNTSKIKGHAVFSMLLMKNDHLSYVRFQSIFFYSTSYVNCKGAGCKILERR